jgi:hypothetical protein
MIDVKTLIEETASRTQVMQLKYFGRADERQGIVHFIGTE